MNQGTVLLANRRISAFPLSIGTSLAFESLFKGRLDPYDPDRRIPEKVDIFQYDQFWINISTLYRNLVDSVNRELFYSINYEALADTVAMEMEIIDSILQHEGQGRCRAVYYFCNYASFRDFQKPFPVHYRRDVSEFKQMFISKLLNVVGRLMRDRVNPNLMFSPSPIHPESLLVRGLILTHIPYDLLSYPHFESLDLLESNTGALKRRSDWWSKYHAVGKRTLEKKLPFVKPLLFVFGDRVQFHPMDLTWRHQILDIGELHRWTSLTSLEKIKLDIRSSSFPEIRNLITQLD